MHHDALLSSKDAAFPPLRAAGADSMHALMPRILAQDLHFVLSGLESSGQVSTKLLLLLSLMGLAPLKT